MPKLVMCGIPRSGSTLVWQIFQEVVADQEILKTHVAQGCNELCGGRDTTLIITYRDPRDVAASLYRIRISRGGDCVGGEEGLKCVIHRTQLYFNAARAFQGTRHLFLKYEEFVDDQSVVFDGIAELTGVMVPATERARIVEKYSVDENRKRAAALKDFTEVGECLIHGDHIGPVVPGSWRKELPPWGCKMIEKGCRKLVETWGYA